MFRVISMEGFRVGFPRATGRVVEGGAQCSTRPGSLGLGDLTLSAYFLLAVTLKELTLCGLGFAHSVRFFTIQDELYTYPTSASLARRAVRAGPRSAFK
jgi:hypothetical protein